MTGLVHFSLDASSNDTAAPPINFVEGAPANTVNNSIRAMMAALAAYEADNSGSLVASGAAGNLLILSTNQIFTLANFSKAFTLAFTADAVNSGPVSIVVDGITRLLHRPGSIPLGPGDISPGRVYRVAYVPALSRFIVVSPEIVPPGTYGHFATPASIPSGWIECDGSAVGRDTHAALFGRIGAFAGPGNGSTTFNLPDLGGRAIFSRNGAVPRLTAAGGINGNVVGAVGGADTVTLSVAQMPAHGHDAEADEAGGRVASETGQAGAHDHGGLTGDASATGSVGTTEPSGAHNHSGNANANGQHAHPVLYETLFGFQSGGGLTAVIAIGGGPNSGNTNQAGNHTHALTVNNSAEHAHGVSTGAVPPHDHEIAGVEHHRHSIPAVDPHTHPVTVENTGNGAAHPNMPPGIVGVIAIKA